MKILDPKQVQEALLVHKKFIEKPREKIAMEEVNVRLFAQIEKLKTLAPNLDGSELESLKHEVQVLYVLLVRLQISLKEANNPELAKAFVFRKLEQDQLSMREMREVLPNTLENIEKALKQSDLPRVWARMGGIVGGVAY